MIGKIIGLLQPPQQPRPLTDQTLDLDSLWRQLRRNEVLLLVWPGGQGYLYEKKSELWPRYLAAAGAHPITFFAIHAAALM